MYCIVLQQTALASIDALKVTIASQQGELEEWRSEASSRKHAVSLRLKELEA